MDQSFFEQVVFSLDSPIYVTDTEGIIVYVNPAFMKVTGYTESELIGEKTSIIKSGKMPDSYYQRLWASLLAGKTWKEEIINRRKDGSDYVVLQYVTPLRCGQNQNSYFAAVQHDITHEKELQNEREIFFDVSIDMFCIMEEQGSFKQINEAWQSILGWDKESLIQKPMLEIIHPDDRAGYAAMMLMLHQTDEIYALDIRLRTTDNTWRWTSWRYYFNTKNRMIYASGRDIQKRVEMEEKIREISVTDALTGVYNRLKFNEELEKELIRSRRYHSPCSLIMFDIDHFKRINDTYGHGRGDEVLKTLTRVVQNQLREPDILCRWGGEEFVIICPNTEAAEAFALSERIRRVIENHPFEEVQRITVSSGTGGFDRDKESGDSLLLKVDRGLYQAKNLGRNRTIAAV